MSGALAAMLGGGSPDIVVVTLGASSPSAGFSTGLYGSLTPAGPFAVSIDQIKSNDGADFSLLLFGGANPQALFRYLLVSKGDGTFRQYTSASATYSTPGGIRTSWLWGDGSSRVWETTDSGEVHSVSFFR